MEILILILSTLVIWGIFNRVIKDEDDDFELILTSIEDALYDSIISLKKKLSWKKH